MSKLGPGTLVLGIFAVLFGLVAAYGAKQYLAEKPAPEAPAPPPPPRLVNIPMASIDLPAGRTVAFGDIMIVAMTQEQMQQRGLPPQIMIDANQVIGRTLRTEVKKGSPFLTEELYPEGTGPSVAERLEPGFRAVTVPLDNSEAEMSLLSPGDVADIVFRTFADEESRLPETTVTLLENVEILAIGSETFPGQKAGTMVGRTRGSTSVTLSCTPDQASALKVVQNRGSLSLVLRGPEDNQLVGSSPPRTLESLLELPEPEPPVTTQIFRRGHLTTSIFEEGRQVVISESFGGLPVAAETGPSTSVRPISYNSTTGRVAASSTKEATSEKPCGCGGE